MNLLLALICGTLFGAGLAVSGMTDPAKVIGFLDVTGAWDPTLGFVMGGGLLITVPFFQLVLQRTQGPWFAKGFRLPDRHDIDARLITGAAMFGIGWGLVGLCPGPAISSLAYLNLDILYFGIAMTAGMFIADRF
ncbi:MAG: YeeE/YedE family protein [Pseudomonadales bacterium]|nr:YeeE/YedE family protein [Pseudomonadales bacterium]MBO6596517.1 YeeE/YedE family protein [Pseudomonadales bacterium]MBO6823494.1 YeeE/YedE family protein [Pseudomonadales bacterium]